MRAMDKAMEALKPCPFCNYKASLQPRGDVFWVQCDSYECRAEGSSKFSEAEAIAAWNTRATPEPVAPPSPDIAGLVRGLEDAAVALLTLGGKDYSDSVKAIDEAAAAIRALKGTKP